jgi:hypothetical protein
MFPSELELLLPSLAPSLSKVVLLEMEPVHLCPWQVVLVCKLALLTSQVEASISPVKLVFA